MRCVVCPFLKKGRLVLEAAPHLDDPQPTHRDSAQADPSTPTPPQPSRQRPFRLLPGRPGRPRLPRTCAYRGAPYSLPYQFEPRSDTPFPTSTKKG